MTMADFRGDDWVKPAGAALPPGPFTRLIQVIDRTREIRKRTKALESKTTALDGSYTQVDGRVQGLDSNVVKLADGLLTLDTGLKQLRSRADTQQQAIEDLLRRVADLECSGRELAQKLADAELRLQAPIDTHGATLSDHDARIQRLEAGYADPGGNQAKPRK
jgi:chromosome segregation ATPase